MSSSHAASVVVHTRQKQTDIDKAGVAWHTVGGHVG